MRRPQTCTPAPKVARVLATRPVPTRRLSASVACGHSTDGGSVLSEQRSRANRQLPTQQPVTGSAPAPHTVRPAVCSHDCPDACALRVTVEEGRVVAVQGDPDHEFTRGFICHKVARYPERVHHAQRLLTPLKRSGPKGRGQFRPIQWDTALDEIAGRFARIAASSDGPQAILPYSYCGTMGKIQGESLDRRFFHRLGASLLDRTICATAGKAGWQTTVGTGPGCSPEAFDDSRLIINWGSNTAVTNVHLWVRMHEARRRGARIVTIDPYRSRTARRSDWHLAPRVGTDAALALGLLHILFRDGHADWDYLNHYCLGAEPLRDRVLEDYGPLRVAAVTGLPVGDIERLAADYATQQPAAIRVNYGLQRHRGGGMAVRTIACLPAVLGSWTQRGGGILLSTSACFELNTPGLQRPDLIPPGTRTVNMIELGKALHGELDGPPVRALYVYNCNPAAVTPDQQRVLSGLARDDLFVVVHEQFATDTVDYADIVLPATTQFEHFDLYTAYGHQWLQVNEPVIDPVGQSRANTDVFRALAERMGFESEMFAVGDEDLAREALWEFSERRPDSLRHITLDRLQAERAIRVRSVHGERPYAEGGFQTPSGKCELFSPTLQQQGHDPLPHWIPPAESAEAAPELAARFPLQLLSPPSPHFLNSTFVNVPSLRDAAREPELEICRPDAEERGIEDGGPVRVYNDRGGFRARACVRDTVRPGVVVAAGLWWNKYTPEGHNANSTTSSRPTDMGGGATFFDNLVEVEPVT